MIETPNSSWGGIGELWTLSLPTRGIGYITHTRQILTKRLATVNRSHVSIRGQPCENFPNNLITTQNLVAVSHTVCAHVRGPKHFGGSLGITPPPGNMGVDDPL